MFKRLLSPSFHESFFLFGARGTGKTTWINDTFSKQSAQCEFLDFLDPEVEERFQAHPNLLNELSTPKSKKWIVIDEVQKVPKILDVVHHLIEKNKQRFVLTGSSSRKLKKVGANLLAGRAFVYTLHPLTHQELGSQFDLVQALQWGTLPKILALPSDRDKKLFLKAYTQTYLKEEILIEQLVRNVIPFRDFLKIAAHESTHTLNYEKIANQLGVDNKTVQTYFDILEDTFLGFRLPGFDGSVRKSQQKHPKFYFFDSGVQRALTNELMNEVVERTGAFGDLFEQFIINEVRRLNEYRELEFEMSHLRTKNEVEIDLILSRGRERFAVEIKSSDKIDLNRVQSFERLAQDIPNLKRMFYVSRDAHPIKIGKVECVHWKDFLAQLS